MTLNNGETGMAKRKAVHVVAYTGGFVWFHDEGAAAKFADAGGDCIRIGVHVTGDTDEQITEEVDGVLCALRDLEQA